MPAPGKWTAHGPLLVPLNGCSGALTLEARDAKGQLLSDGETPPVLVRVVQGDVTLFQDPDCSTPVGTNVALMADGGVRVYLRGATPGPFVLHASGAPLWDGIFRGEVDAGLAARVVFLSPPRTTRPGFCSEPIVVGAVDQNGFPAPAAVSGYLNVSLPGIPGDVFLDASCQVSAANGVLVAAGDMTGTFYIRALDDSEGFITVSGDLIPTVQQPTRVTNSFNAMTVFDFPQSVEAGTCKGPFELFAPPVSTNSEQIFFRSTPNDVIRVYLDAQCQQPAVGALATQTSRSFYLRAEQAGPASLRVDLLGYPPLELSTVVMPRPATRLGLAEAPLGTVVGACSRAFKVQTQDVFGNARTTSQPINVALRADGAAPVTFYTDATCGQPTDDVILPVASGEAEFYVRSPEHGLAELVLSAPGYPEVRHQWAAGSRVRRGECAIPEGSRSGGCEVFPPLEDLGRDMLIHQAVPTEPEPNDASVICDVQGPRGVRCDRIGVDGMVFVSWQVAELAPPARVQRRTTGCQGSPTIVQIDPVPTAQSFVLMSRRSPGQTYEFTDFAAVVLRDSFVEVHDNVQSCSYPSTTHLQVVTMPGADVEHGQTAIQGSSQEANLITSGDDQRAALLYSWTVPQNTGSSLCRRVVRGEIVDPYKLRFSRGAGAGICTNDSIPMLSYARVQFPFGSVAQQRDVSLNGGQMTTTLQISPVDPDRTLVFTGGQFTGGQAHGEGRSTSGNRIGEMAAVQVLRDSNVVELRRTSASSEAEWSVFVVQLPE